MFTRIRKFFTCDSCNTVDKKAVFAKYPSLDPSAAMDKRIDELNNILGQLEYSPRRFMVKLRLDLDDLAKRVDQIEKNMAAVDTKIDATRALVEKSIEVVRNNGERINIIQKVLAPKSISDKP